MGLFLAVLATTLLCSLSHEADPGLRLRDQSIDTWETTMQSILANPDPLQSNAATTLAHHDLSIGLRNVIGKPGANFHTWAIWGSLKARSTIARQDFPLVEAVLESRKMRCRGKTAQSCLGSGILSTYEREANHASQQILKGNKLVLSHIGVVSARFIRAMKAGQLANEMDLERFVRAIPDEGARTLHLRNAFRAYWKVGNETDPRRAQNQLLFANLSAILCEHMLLQPIIRESMRKVMDRLITRYQLGFRLGGEFLSVSMDVPPLSQQLSYPNELDSISLPELARFIEDWGSPTGIKGSAAKNWADIKDRMHFVTSLFRTRQLVPELFELPTGL